MKNPKIHKEFLKLLISIFVIIAVAITGVIFANIYLDEDLFYIIVLLVLFAFLFINAYYKKRFDAVINWSYSYRIRNNASGPMDINHMVYKHQIVKHIQQQDFITYVDETDYTLLYKIDKDHIKKTFPKYILQIMIVIKKQQVDFYIDDINPHIDKLIEELRNQKKRTYVLLVTQFKTIDTLTDEDKKALKDIVFIRTNRGIISTINVGLHYDSGKAVLLYSNTYSPSLYYKYHIQNIKEIV